MPNSSENDMKDKEEEFNKRKDTFAFLFPHEKVIKLIEPKNIKHEQMDENSKEVELEMSVLIHDLNDEKIINLLDRITALNEKLNVTFE